jgi:hypothetical protein
MAKTTSQIIAENKIKRAKAAAIAAARDEIHREQMQQLNVQEIPAPAPVKDIAPEIPQIDTTVPSSSPTQGSSYLTGNVPGISSPYAAGVLARQQMQNQNQEQTTSGNRVPGNQKALFDPYSAVTEAQQQVRNSPEYQAEMQRRAAEDYQRRQQQAAEDQSIRDADMKEIESWSDEDRTLLESYVREKNERDDPFTVSNPFRFLLHNKKVADRYTPLVEKFGEERLEELAETYGIYLTEQDAETLTEQTAQAVDSFGGAIGHNVLGVGARLVGGPYAAMGRMKEAFERTGRYSTLAAYTPQDMLSLYGNTVVSETAQNIGGDEYSEEGEQVTEGGAVRQGLSYAYQGVMSAADSIARALVGGKVGALALAAAGSFSQTVSDASRQGATPQQAVILGVGSATLETLTEKIPLDEMFRAAKGGTKGVIPILKEAFRQAGIEATTEELSLAGNLILEAAILKENSSYNQKIGELVANGASYAEAQEQVNREIFNEALQTAVVSAFAGVFSGDGSALVGGFRQNAAPEASAPAAQEVAPEAVAEAPVTPVVEQAQQDAAPSVEQLLDGVQDMTPAPAPLTQEQQHFDNAAAIVNGMEPAYQEESTYVNTNPNRQTETASSSSGDAEDYRVTSDNATKSDAVPDTILPRNGMEDKENPDIFENTQAVDTLKQPAEGGQNAGGTVGAMQSQFQHDVKQSRVYGNTYKNTQYADIHDIGRAAKKADPNIDQYDVITEAESLHEADLRTQTGRDRLVEHNALMKKSGWTGADNDTAMKLLTAYRKEGKRDRFLELSRKQRQMGTQAGQMVQSFAKYSREDATVAVQDAIADLDELSIDQVDRTFWKPKQETKGAEGKQDAFQKWKESITGSLLEVANDIENVKDGDKDSMKDLIRQIANLRHTTAWAGYSSDLSRRTERGLDKMDFDTLKTVAKTQLSMIPNDFRKRDTGEILKQIRVQNMLFTIATKFKNDSGNISNGLMDAISDSFGGRMIDAIIGKWTGTRTVGNDLKFAKEYSRAARDAADVAAAFVSLDIPMETDAKYSNGRTRTWSPNTTNVLARMMSAYEKHMKYALEVSDKFYEGGATHVVNRSLQELGEKSNLTQEQIQDIAQKTGQRRTFKDPGVSVSKDGRTKKGRMFARANVGLQRGLNQIGTENIGLGDLVMPFAAVSGEVKQVGMDYTGGGLISGLNEIISIAKDVRNGKEIDPYRQRMAATDFGRGMTGVGLIVAFTALAASGAIKVHNDRDSEERMMNQTQGLSGAQWNLNASLRWWEAIMGGATAEEAAKASKWQNGDELITIDFLEPFNTQMHIGYLLSQGEDVLAAIAQGNFDSLLEMPMMQTLSDLADLQQAFTEVSDGDMGGVYDAVGQLVGTVAGSVVPNWVRKTAQIVDPYYRNTYDTNPFKKAGKDVLAAIPFASRILPQTYDNLGKEQRRYEDSEWMTAAFDNLVTPWDTDTYWTNDVYQEIQRLNTIDGVDVTPPRANRKITYTDQNGADHKNYVLTAEEYETLQRVQGQTAATVINDMISSKDYAALTDKQKAEAIQMAYNYARQTGQIAALDNHLGYSESWMRGIKDREARTIIARTAEASLEGAMEDIQTSFQNGWDIGTSGDDLKWAYDTFAQLGKIAQEKVEDGLSGVAADYVEARRQGISHETFLNAAELLAGIEPQNGSNNPRDFQIAEAIAGMDGISEAEKTTLIRQQITDSQGENLDEMLGLGYGPEEYAEILKIYRNVYDSNSSTKKNDFIKRIMDRYGLTRAEANAIYQIYK